MTQYSFIPPFTTGGDDLEWNKDVIEWHCERCGVRIADKGEAVAHVRIEHGSGNIWPRFSVKGKELILTSWKLRHGSDATELALSLMTAEGELRMLESMGAKPEWVQRASAALGDRQDDKGSAKGIPTGIPTVEYLADSRQSTSEIRQFLTEAFGDDELSTFCFGYFRDVYDDFAFGMTKGQKIQQLIEHCERRGTLPSLIAAIQKVRPEQYEKWQAFD